MPTMAALSSPMCERAKAFGVITIWGFLPPRVLFSLKTQQL